MSIIYINPYSFYDPDAQAYITAVETADGQGLEDGVKNAINSFVIGCKADGLWSAIKASCILAGARTLSGALVPLVGTAPTNNNFVYGDYKRKTGLKGNGTNKYLMSGRNNNTDPQDNQHLSVYVSTATTAVGGYPNYIGCGVGNSGSSCIGRLLTNGNLFIRSRSSAYIERSSVAGFLGISRSLSTSYISRVSSTNTTHTRASATPFNTTLGVFQDGANPTSTTYNDGVIAFYSIGESLSLALLDTRVTALISAYATAIGLAVGDTGPGGGIVFYVSGNTYYEFAPNQGGRTWSTGGNQTLSVTGADGTAIGTGYQNTLDIIAQSGNVSGSCAAVLARNYTNNGFSDWFLPSKDEAIEMASTRAITGFSNGGNLTWTSSESASNRAWLLWDNYTPTESFSGATKAYTCRVYPVRTGTT